MSNFLRLGFLSMVAILVLAKADIKAQATTLQHNFIIAAGAHDLTLDLNIPLQGLSVSDVKAVSFQLDDGQRLPDGLSIKLASAKTQYAARKPYLTLSVEVERASKFPRVNLKAIATVVKAPLVNLAQRTGPSEPVTSVLADGQTIKLEIDADGIFQIDAAFLSELGLSGSPGSVRLYSKGGAMLPELVGAPYPVDLQEVALFEVGNGNDTWEDGEKLLFYGQGEDVWIYDEDIQDFTRVENLYSERTYYYLKIGGSGLRTQTQLSRPVSTYQSSYTFRDRWEEDLENLLYISQLRYNSGQGSGQDWFGYQFGTSRSVTKRGIFELGVPIQGLEGKLRASAAASSVNRSTSYTVDLNGSSYRSTSFAQGVRSDANNRFAHRASVSVPVTLTSGTVDVTVNYPGTLEANPAWLDFVELTYPCELIFDGDPLFFRSSNHVVAADYGFSVQQTTPDQIIWDISDPIVVKNVETEASGNSLRFGYTKAENTQPSEFVIFDPSLAYPKPALVTELEPTSNLHSIQEADMLIIYGEGLETAAETLAEHRRSHSNLNVATAKASEVFEEFGGGRPDPTAIRAIAKMIFDRDPQFRYLLLLGDGHFDPRGIKRPEPNLIPTYQTKGFGWEVDAFPTDDYFGLLDEGEGRNNALFPSGILDLAIGRIPVTQPSDAVALVEKIITYDSDPASLGDWRLRTVFVADDEDSNQHLTDMDGIANDNARDFPVYNQQKIYADAFEQQSTSGGTRIPRAAEAINQNMFRGSLIMSYLGHGGPNGWAQERILNFPDIDKWNNPTAFPIFITATCTFTGFDDPERTVAGEAVLAKRNGGAVATMSTVRPVFISQNRVLAEKTHNVLFTDSLNLVLSAGQLFQKAKNESNAGAENNRKYFFFGDPSMMLARPRLKASLLSFDGIDLQTSSDSATVGPLREFEVSGIVTTQVDELIADFNGEVVLTVYGQERTGRTLGQDAGSTVRNFNRIGSTLFSGRASVSNGRFTAKLMLPLDLALDKGAGRMSIYVSSEDGRDGAGLFNRFIIDGRATPGVIDENPPIVNVFLGDEEFVEGGTTNADPVLFVRLSDDTGINVSGASIGHDLTATLTGVQEGNYILNDFYKADKDDYGQGEARFPVFDLPKGEYRLEVRAWDLANNPGTGATSFIVTDDEQFAINRVLNYPNPFVDATCFQFEHNAAGQQIEVQIDIYTTSGRLVKSLEYAGTPSGYRFGNTDCIAWDGRDQFGQELARGVYLYKVSMRAVSSGEKSQSKFEKLVVLR